MADYGEGLRRRRRQDYCSRSSPVGRHCSENVSSRVEGVNAARVGLSGKKWKKCCLIRLLGHGW
jgi:hypothetical protein